MIAHKCICLDKAPLFVDGDQGKVYHEICEGYISDVEDFTGFTDKFWNDQLNSRDDAVVINGEQYRIGSTPYPKKGYGFGGEHYRIKLVENGLTIDTADLWHQGTVPEEYRGVLQDTAKFVRLIKISEYKQCPNCKDLMNRDTCYKTSCNGVTLTNAESLEVKSGVL
jgi:hypothetical protein